MITLNKSYQLIPAVANAPYTYTWKSSNPCVSFSPKTGTTTNGQVDVAMSFPDATCLSTSTISIDYTGTLGCSYSNTVAITNVCESFNLSPINLQAPFTFGTSAASPNCSQITFTWVYDTNLFSLVQQSGSATTSELKLSLKSGTALPATTDITVKAVDCNGCEKIEVYTYTFSNLVADDRVIDLLYAGDKFASGIITFMPPSGYSTIIDWTTLEFTIGETRITPIVSSYNLVYFEAPLSLPTGQYVGTYTYKDLNGVSAIPGQLQFIVHPYRTVSPITTSNLRYEIPCSVLAGAIVNIPIENSISVTPGTVVDWSSFALVTPPVTLSPSITLTTDINGDHVIAYQTPNPESDDAFGFTICDTNGNCARASVVTVVNCVTAPIAVADAACAVCNQTTEIDVLANDTSAGTLLDTNSIVITQQPASGGSYVNNGKLYYTAGTNTNGVQTIKYTVDNTYGTTSNEATVTVTSICAGPDQTVNLCTDSIVPYDVLLGATTGGVWTYTGTLGTFPTPPVLHDDPLDFTGMTKNLAYEYTYTLTSGSCSDSAKVTIYAYDYSVTQNFICSKSANAGITPTTSDVNYTFINQTNAASCPGPGAPIFETAIAVPAAWQSPTDTDYAGDLWYKVTVSTAASSTLIVEANSSGYAGDAMIYPNIAVYDACATGNLLQAFAPGTTQFYTSGVINIVGATSTTYYIRVASLLENAGKFNLKLTFFVNP